MSFSPVCRSCMAFSRRPGSVRKLFNGGRGIPSGVCGSCTNGIALVYHKILFLTPMNVLDVRQSGAWVNLQLIHRIQRVFRPLLCRIGFPKTEKSKSKLYTWGLLFAKYIILPTYMNVNSVACRSSLRHTHKVFSKFDNYDHLT